MKRLASIIFLGLVLLMASMVMAVAPAPAAASSSLDKLADSTPAPEDIITGAQLFDKWYAVLGVPPPDGNSPNWARQSTNSRSGPDTWRCVECHGWDYKGAQGAYASGSHATGFPGVKDLVTAMTVEDIVAHLNGAKDPSHDFSAYMDDATLTRVAEFLKFGLIDDDVYIDDVSLKVIGGDIDHGKKLFEQTCVQCHGSDGKQIVFRTEGVDEYLGSVASRDPWRFLHRTRFGVAGTTMPVGASLGWSAEDGRDILTYAQTLPTGVDTFQPGNVGSGEGPSEPVGGPPSTLWGGILTALATFFGGVGIAVSFIVTMIAIGFAVIYFLRRKN